jgi:hypothetical protein
MYVTLADDTLINDSSGNELMVTFKGFDFLDNELNEESEVSCVDIKPVALFFVLGFFLKIFINKYYTVFILIHYFDRCIFLNFFNGF